jgi:hypothetical protein
LAPAWKVVTDDSEHKLLQGSKTSYENQLLKVKAALNCAALQARPLALLVIHPLEPIPAISFTAEREKEPVVV